MYMLLKKRHFIQQYYTGTLTMFHWALIVIIVGVTTQAKASRDNRGVCSRQVERVPVLYNETFIQPKYQPYLTTCQGYRACSKYRTVYTVSVRQMKKELLRVKSVCCPGWKKKEPTSEDCEEDIDECRRPSKPCPQLCINTRGSYRCECQPGFTLGEDGKSCTENKAPSQLPAQQAEDASHRLSNEIQELRNLVETLEQRLDSTLSAVQRLFPVKLSEIHSDQVHEFWERIQSLDRMDSFSDQLMYMEEKMGECSCRSNEIEMAVNLKR
eukprot:XP_012824048.1 PREDICTED: epidermal growth factor-like protein 8 isoform X2 [Xenopus tropicalis]